MAKKTSATAQKIFYKFDSSELSKLQMMDFENPQTFQPVSLKDLEDEGTGFEALLNAAGNGEGFDSDSVLYVKLDGEVLNRVYVPTVFRADATSEELVLRSGDNHFPVSIVKGNFEVGCLKGGLVSIKEYGKPSAALLFRGKDAQFLVRLAIAFEYRNEPLIRMDMEQALRKDGSIVQYLNPCPGSVNLLKLWDLGEGEYNVASIDFVPAAREDWADRYHIRLTDDRLVQSNSTIEGLLKKRLDDFEQKLSAGDSVCLCVAGIRKTRSGYTTCSASIKPRAARQNSKLKVEEVIEVSGF